MVGKTSVILKIGRQIDMGIMITGPEKCHTVWAKIIHVPYAHSTL